MKKFFIIGTDTEVGKTYISTNLIKAYQAQNIDSICLKPVASGKSQTSDMCEDVEQIYQAYNQKYSAEKINQVSFTQAVAPHIIAAQTNTNISLEKLQGFVENNYSSKHDVTFVEGAGGLLTPYSNQTTQFDLIKMLNIPVLLVTAIKVGCINHTLLTINELKRHNIKILGWVANASNQNTKFIDEQITTIEKFSGYKALAKIPQNADYLDFIELSKMLISPEENE